MILLKFMKNNLRRALTLALATTITVSAVMTNPALVLAAEDYYISSMEQGFDSMSPSVNMPAGVTADMCEPSYWYDKGLGDEEALLADQDQIQEINAKALATKATIMHDLASMKGYFDADQARADVLEEEIPTRDLYVDGVKIDNEAYFGAMVEEIKETALTGIQPYIYAVAATRANMKSWPTNDVIGYSPTDADDEMQGTAVIVNEPFLIKQKCIHEGKTFYWGMSSNCMGWIDGDNLAICKDYEEWIGAWKMDPKAEDFLVVTQSKIVTEPSIQTAHTSKVELSLGTALKLVPEDQIPANIGERNDWFQYVVYLPVRAEDGSYEAKPCLISGKYDVSIGYLPYTQKNVLDIAFTCLGDRYGWGGMLESMDCSMYTRSIYRCFGFELPRNTNWQQQIPDTKIDLSGMTAEEKYHLISELPIGTLLYLPGHTMVYTGTENDKNYVISCSGSVADSEGELDVKSVYSCILNPLTVRRRSGLTWLDSLTAAVVLTDLTGEELKEENVILASDITKTYNKKSQTFAIKTSAKGDVALSYESNNPSIKVDDQGKVTVKAGYIGEAKISIRSNATNLYKEAEKTITVRILPSKTSLKSVKNVKTKTIQVKWKASFCANGYQLQYGTSKTFAKNTKSVSLKKASITSKKIKGLKKNKVYYVRIRTYKQVGDKKFYSSWSNKKQVKVK